MVLFKSKEVPEELPDLPLDKITEEFKKEFSKYSKLKEQEEKEEKIKESEYIEKEDFSKEEKLSFKPEVEDSFFNDFLKDLEKEIKDLNNLEEWFKNNFVKKDVINNMKGYWQGQKKDLFLRGLVQSFKEKISENIKKLQKLELEWQEIYFKLVEKEEQMKKQEEDLRKAISEFINIGKKISLKNEQKKQKQEKK